MFLALIGVTSTLCFAMYRILRNHGKDLKDDLTNSFNQRFDAVDRRFDAVDKRLDDFNRRFDDFNKQLIQLNQNLIEHLKHHN